MAASPMWAMCEPTANPLGQSETTTPRLGSVATTTGAVVPNRRYLLGLPPVAGLGSPAMVAKTVAPVADSKVSADDRRRRHLQSRTSGLGLPYRCHDGGTRGQLHQRGE